LLIDGGAGQVSAVAGIMLVIIVVVSIFDILSQFLRKVVIDGEDHAPFVAYLAALTVFVILLELILARVIDVDPLIRMI